MKRKHFMNLCLLASLSWTITSCSSEKSQKNRVADIVHHEEPLTDQDFNENEIPIVTLDSKNQLVESTFSKESYVAQSFAATSELHDSLLPVLDKLEEAGKPSSWSLRVIGIGIGITAEIGVGPVGVGILPKIRLIYTNHSNPLPPPLLM